MESSLVNTQRPIFSTTTIITNTIKWIITTYAEDKDWLEISRCYVDRFNRHSKHKGITWTLKYYKIVRLCVTKYIAGEPLQKMDIVSLDYHGLPRILSRKFRMKIINGNTNDLRIILTLLTIGRCFTAPIKPDTDSITQPWNGYVPSELILFLRSRKWVKLDGPDMPRFVAIRWSTKRGPAGGALEIALPLVGSLPEWLRVCIDELGGQNLKEYMLDITKSYSEHLKSDLTIRKLHHLQDKEGKTRTIAILDWWSQTALIPYHEDLMGLLRKVPGDFTYSRSNLIGHLSEGQGLYYSIDLSSATDRFPMIFQKELWEVRYGKQKADAWAEIMVKQPFVSNGTELAYKAGQPIGAYTSWVTFSLCHHVIMQYIKSKFPTTRYAILGDDIVIRGCEGAKEYRRIIGILQVPISDSKTHVSHDTFEFAKRWYKGSDEITGFPTNSLIQASTRFVDLASTFAESESRWGASEILTRPDLIISYLTHVHRIWRRHANNVAWLTSRLLVFNNWINNPLDKNNYESIRFLDDKISGSITEKRILVAIGTAGVIHGAETDIKLLNAVKTFWAGRTDQILQKKGDYDPPVIRALRDTAVAITYLTKDSYSIVAEAGIYRRGISSADFSPKQVLRQIAQSAIPSPTDLTKRSSALIMRSTARLMKLFVCSLIIIQETKAKPDINEVNSLVSINSNNSKRPK